MRRKLVQHGLSSLTLSLPRKWIKNNQLSKGEELEIEESEDKLVICAKRKQRIKKISVDVTDAGLMIKKIVGATYKAGYDEVNVKFKSFEELEAVQKLIKEQFTGFEIISQTKEMIVIKSISKLEFEEFEESLKRFFTILNQISTEASQAIIKEDYSWLKKITLLKKESDKFADFCRRAILSGFKDEKRRSEPLYVIIEELEKVSDRYRDLCEIIYEKKLKMSSKIQSLSKEIDEFLGDFYFLFYNFDMDRLIKFGKSKTILQKKIEGLYSSVSKEELKVLVVFDKIVNLIFDLNGPLMAVHL